MTFGERLYQLLSERGWDIDELSRRSGLSKSHLVYLERDVRPPGPATVQRLASAFGLEPSSLDPQYRTRA